MRLLAGTVVVVLMLLAWLLLVDPPADPTTASAEPGAVELPGRPAESSGQAVASREEAVRAPADAGVVSAAPDVGLARAAAAEPATRRLSGLLTDGANGPALVGYALEMSRTLTPGRALTTVVTDVSGRFVTEPLPCVELSLRHVPDLEGPDRALQLWIRPARITLPPGDDGAPYERSFFAQRPADVVVVDVVQGDGRPAAGAFVQLRFTALDMETGRRLSTGGAAETGSGGRAYVGLYDSAGFERGTLFARGADGTVSEVLALDRSDYTGPHRLRLGAACALTVRARWSEGTPAKGREVRLQGPRDFPRPGEPERCLGVTDDEGVCTLVGLYAAEYTASVENPRTLGRDSGTTTLWPGETSALEIELRSGARELAASGAVLDEGGAPLAGVELVFRADRRWAESVSTDERGRFECWAEPCDALRIALDALPHGDTFEPAARSVPFGAHGLVFQRVARAVQARFTVHVTDRATGAAIDEVYLTFDRGPEREEWSNTYAPRESYTIDAGPETRCKVAARGFVPRTLPLLAALEEAPGDPPRLEVALDRGLVYAVRVLDADTRAPVAGATFKAHGVAPVRTDAQGWARLEADRWATFAVICEGYDPAGWDPEDGVLFDHGPVFLSATP